MVEGRAPRQETPPAIGNEFQVFSLMKTSLATPAGASPPTAPLRADRVVGGVPGNSADVLQLPLCGAVEGDIPERVLVQDPLPLDDLQGHGQVPLLVEVYMMAQEGEVDLLDLLK